MKLFFNILLYIVVTVFLAVATLLLISILSIPSFPLDSRTVLTGSMEPAIPTGSVVFIYPKADYAEGDIVTFKRIESSLEVPITHRIVAAAEGDGDEREFTTKGDANDYADRNPVLESEIYGKVIFHLPFIGYLLDVAKTPWGFLAIIIIPAFLVIVDEVKKIMVSIRTSREGVKENETERQD